MAHDAHHPRALPRPLRAGLVLGASLLLHAGLFLLARSVEPRPPPPPGTTAIQVTYTDLPPLPSRDLGETPQPVRRPRKPIRRVEKPTATVAEPTPEPEAPAEPEETAGTPVVAPVTNDTGSPGEGVGGPPKPGPPRRDLRAINLFDRSAIGRIASMFSPSLPSRDDVGGGGNGDDPASEQARVSARLGSEIEKMVALGNAQSGLVSDCFDGIDQGFDDAIDCAAEGCRAHPFCAGTRVYDAEVHHEIPDDDLLGAPSAIDVEESGPVRAVSVKVAFTHASPGDLAIVLEGPDGRRAVLRRADRSDPLYGRAFFVRDLVGSRSGGPWRLRVMDVISGVTGRFDTWQLVVTSG